MLLVDLACFVDVAVALSLQTRTFHLQQRESMMKIEGG